MLQNYMACSSNSSENLDFFSLNAYEWCGDSSYTTSGYSQLQTNASSYDIPIFFSETGCNTVKPRTFGDQAAIFSDEMIDTWSGAIIYEWIEEANDASESVQFTMLLLTKISMVSSLTAQKSTLQPQGLPRTATRAPASPRPSPPTSPT